MKQGAAPPNVAVISVGAREIGGLLFLADIREKLVESPEVFAEQRKDRLSTSAQVV